MKLETFFNKFELFADAPDAVGKMRELVLRLALDGRLIGSNSSKWRRVSLGSLGEWGSGGTPLRSEPRYYGGKVPWLVIGDLNDVVVTSASTFITEEGLENSSARMLPKDVLLIAMYGSIGKLGITGIECATNQAIAFCKPDARQVLLRYLFHTVKAIQPALLKRGQGLAQKNISQTILKAWEISLPPLAEQKSIVAKVDALMALCDRLEAQQQERETRHAALARASLARFAEAPTPANLEFLFHNGYAIPPADLRKSILTLAVSGKLCERSATKQVRLCEIIELLSGQHLLAHEHNSERRGIPYLTGPSDFGAKYPIPTRWTEYPKVVAEPGDILITVKGSGVGKTNKLVAAPTAISRQLMAVRVTDADTDFVHLVLKNAEAHFQSSMTGIAIPGIGRRDVLNLEVELPPLAEQRRIVAKVDELMALVDKLEAELASARTTASNLLAAAVAELTQGKPSHAAVQH